jgi:hypothetical protein
VNLLDLLQGRTSLPRAKKSGAAELYHHGRISFRPDEELCNIQGNTDRIVIALAPSMS